MDRISPALLVLVDISGYTRFMRRHPITRSHSHQMIARLLRALVEVSQPPLSVAEVEGDAVFFYALAEDQDLGRIATQVKEQILRFFCAFDRQIKAFETMQVCACEACTNVGRLRLKQVIHAGQVAVEKIDRFEKLIGMDVIVAHRMLKNSVPSKEYVMMTNPAYAAFGDFYALEPERRTEQFEGVGEIETLVFYRTSLNQAFGQLNDTLPGRSPVATLAWKLKMHWYALLEWLGLHQAAARSTSLPTFSVCAQNVLHGTGSLPIQNPKSQQVGIPGK